MDRDGAIKLMASDRDWTIVRPGGLADESATRRVRIESAPFDGAIPRGDLAAVLARVLGNPRARHRILYVNGGAEPIDDALAVALAAASSG
jgi:uncharacterized protein YbjT (DUF2867 family)